jgi:hypothetical protein
LERDGSRYAYRLTTKGVEVALLFLFFHKRLCGPLANSRFLINPMPNTAQTAASKPPIIAPTRPSSQSLICSPPLDAAATTVELVFSNILRARIYHTRHRQWGLKGGGVGSRCQSLCQRPVRSTTAVISTPALCGRDGRLEPIAAFLPLALGRSIETVRDQVQQDAGDFLGKASTSPAAGSKERSMHRRSLNPCPG